MDKNLHACFLDNVERLTPPCPGKALAKVYFSGALVYIAADIPGRSLALRILAHVQRNGYLGRDQAATALEVFSPLIPEATSTPGLHPLIDLLLSLGEGQSLDVQFIDTSTGLLPSLLDGSANERQKREAVSLLDRGLVRCAEKIRRWVSSGGSMELLDEGVWVTQPYGVACMNAGFSAFPMVQIGEHFFDKVPLKTEGWSTKEFEESGVRFIPGSFVRKGAYVGPGTTIMPGGIVNIGAYVAGSGVMIDGGARVATGAQIGKGVKLGAGSGIEGILEPPGRLPSIIEDNVRIGANCELCGIIEQGAVIASGVVMASGKKIFDLRTNQEVSPKYMAVGDAVFEIPVIPSNRVAVGGTYKKTESLSVDCILLLEKDAKDTSLAQMPRNTELYCRVS